MQVAEKKGDATGRRTLKDFIPLMLAFFGGLVGLSAFQHTHLFVNGVLDHIINKSLFLLLLHHIGFTAICSLVLVFVFNFLEQRSPNLGYKWVKIILLILLFIEGFLITYFVRNYEILGFDIFNLNFSEGHTALVFLKALVIFIFSGTFFYFLIKITGATYAFIGKMYPFTIILIGLFLATLAAEQKPINENKTRHLIVEIAREVFYYNKYVGKEEFPLVRPYISNDVLGNQFNFNIEKPNIVIIILDGLGSDFVGDNSLYKGFTPFLTSIQSKSLYWENFLSNTGESHAALPSILGSLPFGVNGFTHIEGNTNRNTLFSILKSNGYTTSFHYGGNSAIHHLDRFLDEERVDFIVDSKAFGASYIMQDEDAAGISLGYPDKELYRKYDALVEFQNHPKLDVLINLSSKAPFLIPNSIEIQDKVTLLATSQSSQRISKLIKKNTEVFAGILYADDALSQFFKNYSKKAEYKNTIFLITGSHNLSNLPARDEASRYRVPLMIYSPMLKSPRSIKTLASHADIAPAIIALLDAAYEFKVPQKVAWLGDGLLMNNTREESKEIPLFRSTNQIRDFVYGKYFMSSGKLYVFQNHLEIKPFDGGPQDKILENWKQFKSINKYVTDNNKILPPSYTLFNVLNDEFTKQEMVWINSVFNGKNFDNAYETARELAFGNEKDRALLLCRYILTKIPGHADTEILMGRIYAWQGDFKRAITTLEGAVRKYPVYQDGYAALLDAYFWSDSNEKALLLLSKLEAHEVKSAEIAKKMERAYQHQQKKESIALPAISDNTKTAASITALYP